MSSALEKKRKADMEFAESLQKVIKTEQDVRKKISHLVDTITSLLSTDTFSLYVI